MESEGNCNYPSIIFVNYDVVDRKSLDIASWTF
jgi:hypothetical protein